MTAKSRTAVTMLVLSLIILIAAVWGWHALTAPIPQAAVEKCESTTVAAGETLPRELVAVSVLNASGANGLGSKTMDALVDRGFAAGSIDDAPAGTEAKGIEIWSDDPKNPAVELVRRQFTKATVKTKTHGEASGVVVVVGKQPAKLKKAGPESIKVTAKATVCAPSITD